MLSVTATFINVKKKEGKSYALSLEELKKDVDKPLIAILTINTIAHTVGAILVGVQAKKAFGDEGNGVLIVSAVMTLLILIASEIIPKTIGATYWKQLANFTSKALKFLIFPLKWTGILWILQLTTKLIGGKGHGSILSREDFSVMADIAHEEGVFEESESKVIKNLLNFNTIFAKDIMTPRSVLKIAPEEQDLATFFEANKELRFSRIPVFQNNPDNITGYILKDEVFREMAEDHHTKKLVDLKRKLITVDRNIAVPDLFEKLVEQKEHITLVVDEYGSISGVVTMEDVIETLLGLEIVDESDSHANLQELARKNWENRAKKLGILDKDTEE
ncbi:CNNM domain-containing protein [Aquimarina addita]|uniref:CNNM domain-containing protein n=1 Tax=Aquimarina addita TaxID=870485 RepID=A0ABP7XBF4_9FLAO